MRLFNRHKRAKLMLEIYGADGIIASISPEGFALPEIVVLELSMRYFDDAEPCQIHRAAVLSRAMMELAELAGTGCRYEIAALEAEQRAYFIEYVGAVAFAFVDG